jgi:hypothetical protein
MNMPVTETQRVAWVTPRNATPALPHPILQIRPLRYLAEGHPGALPPVQGLRVQVQGSLAARSEQEAQSGLLRIQDLPAGPRRILLTDPERRFLPLALNVTVPPRLPTRPTIAAPPSAPLPRPTVLLRSAPGRAIPAGMTAVIGTLRDAAGHGIALGMLTVMSVLEGRPARIVTWTAEDGSFALWLPGEAPGLDTPAPPPVTRSFALHLPTPALAAALAADFLGALPADLDGSAATTRPNLFRPATAQLLGPDGTPAAAEPGLLPIRPARTQRWDLCLD